MDLKVEVSNASLDDVVGVAYDEDGDRFRETSLGEAVVLAVVDKLTADPRWAGLADRFFAEAGAYIKDQSKGFVKGLVAAEVTRQLESKAQGAVTHGKPSTRAEAYVAVEVTTQLREKFALVVEQSLTALRGHLNTLNDAAVQDYLNQRRS